MCRKTLTEVKYQQINSCTQNTTMKLKSYLQNPNKYQGVISGTRERYPDSAPHVLTVVIRNFKL